MNDVARLIAETSPAVIQDNVPIPPKGSAAIYPFDQLAVGQCFFIEANTYQAPKVLSRVSSRANYKRLQTGKQFTTRMMSDGIRCWRVA